MMCVVAKKKQVPVGEIDTGLDLSGEISVAEQRALHSNQALLWEVEMTQILDSISQICAEEAAEEAASNQPMWFFAHNGSELA